MIILGFGLAALIGISLGLMGGGGSILTVPVLVYVLGFAAKPAIAMSLPVVGVTSLVGAVSHWRAGNVEVRTALYFGVIAMAGSYFGARVSSMMPGTIQLTVLSAVIIVAAASMMRSMKPRAMPAGTETRRIRVPLWRTTAVGLAIGALTGAVGIGGGFLIVPALVLMGGVPMK
ncbi:MAG: sulfite exporter TauE/SafE family protein, partial [Gemmatimonadaceae bacterium]